MIKMETEVGERAAIAVSLLDADLAASRRLVSDLRRAVECWQTKADAALARAEKAEAEVERLRAARPDKPQELSEDGTTEAEELAFIGEEIRSLPPGRYLLTVGEEEGAFGIRDFSVTGIDESIDVTRLSDLAALREENAKLQRALRIGISEAREFANADEVEFYAQGALCKAERDNAPGKAV